MEGGGDELELNLGLSLNGRFGVDPSMKKQLRRSSSISNLPDHTAGSYTRDNGEAFEVHAPLVRTCSLPTEMEESLRRKEVQDRCHVEARKRRMENGINGDKNASYGGAIQTPQRRGPSGPQPLLQEPISQMPTTTCGGTNSRVENILLRNAMLDMPLVSTQGDGPNGVKVEGFLYRYNIGEPVKIVCVCHGYFLTPAEFYKHGGGGDVDNPLKYISVAPFFIE